MYSGWVLGASKCGVLGELDLGRHQVGIKSCIKPNHLATVRPGKHCDREPVPQTLPWQHLAQYIARAGGVKAEAISRCSQLG